MGNLKAILKDREGEWKAMPAPYATACSNARGFSIQRKEMETSTPPTRQEVSWLSTLDRTYTVQLPPTLGDGKAFSLPFPVA